MLDVAVSEILMREHPDRSEGWLTRARASAVNRRALVERARELEIARWLRLGRGEQGSQRGPNPSLLANALEALIGALYLDGGFEEVRALVERTFGPHLVDPDALVDPKTRLQELLQARGAPTPEYCTTAESGPPHAREFRVAVRLDGRTLGTGAGGSKRTAEQAAARDALERGAP